MTVRVTARCVTVTFGVAVMGVLVGQDRVAEGGAVGRVTRVLVAAVGASALGVAVAWGHPVGLGPVGPTVGNAVDVAVGWGV